MDKYHAVKRACEINDEIFNELLKDFKQFKTEKDIERYILKKFKERKVKPAYDPICANNKSHFHAKPTDDKLEKGFIMLDFACKINGYCSDVTRTIHYGKATKQEKEWYELVKDVQAKCMKKIKAGALAGDVDSYARELLGKKKKYFPHLLGHGVGKKIHERPKFYYKYPVEDQIIKEGDIVTNEPGIYFEKNGKGVGIRIEDSIYVGKNKIEILSKSTKRLIEV